MPGEYYTEEDAFGPRSPGLQPVKVDAKPTEEPPPIVTQIFVSPPSNSRKKSKRRKHRPTQGDWVLIREMDPNRPDIAHAVSQEALNSASEPESSSDEEMQEQAAPPKTMGAPAIRSDSLADANNDFKNNALYAERRESHASQASSNGSALRSVISNTSTNASVNGSTHAPSYLPSNGDSLDSLRDLRLQSPSRDQAGTKLPSIQTQPPSAASPESAASPSQQLPSITQFDELVRSATNESGPTDIFAHRQSISSSGTSPSAPFRSLSLSSHHSPAGQSPFPPFNASSPVSVASDASRAGDIFLRNKEHLTLFGPGGVRRPSQIADGIHPRSASVVEYNSPVGYGADMLNTPIEGGRQRVLSIDGAMASRQLPPPIGSGIQIQQNITGSYKCDTPGCTAAPFQTQYLLKYVKIIGDADDVY